MRTCAISVRGNQTLEIFSKKRANGFEVWTVGMVKGMRTVLLHMIAHDDWEARLLYAKAGDVAWRNVSPTSIPATKHAVALEQEKFILKPGKFQDSEDLRYHVANSLNIITTDRKSANAAKKALLGRWTDGIATVVFAEGAKLELTIQPNQNHPFDMCRRVHGQPPNWWSFAGWTLHLMYMSDDQRFGQRTFVVNVDEHELHFFSNQPDRIAHVFHRRR